MQGAKRFCSGYRRPIVGVVGAVVLVVGPFGLFVLTAPVSVWDPHNGSRGGSYCEGIHGNSATRTDANTWSNLGYVAAGGWILGRAVDGRLSKATINDGASAVGNCSPPAVLPHPLILAVGLSNFALGVGSLLFHASLLRWSHQLDVAAMYWVMNASLAAAAWRWLRRCAPVTAPNNFRGLSPLLATMIILDAVMFVFKWRLSAAVVSPLQLGVVILLECLHTCGFTRDALRKHLCLVLGALVIAVIGLLARTHGVALKKRRNEGGQAEAFCDPEGAFQLHAVWHVLTAIALLALFELQRGPLLLSHELPLPRIPISGDVGRWGGGRAVGRSAKGDRALADYALGRYLFAFGHIHSPRYRWGSTE